MKSKELPEGGQIKKISELIIDQLSGFACAIDTMVEKDGYVQLRPFNFGDNGRLKLDTLYQIPIDQVDKNLYSLRKGDILFNNTNSIELVGKSVLVDKEYPFAFSNHINRLRVDTNSVIPAYFQYQLRHMWIKEHFALNCKKWIGQAGYTFNKLAEQMIFLPSLENQQKIVEKLDNQMAQIEMMKKEAEKEKEAVEIFFLPFINEILTRYSSNSKAKKIKDVIEINYGKSLSGWVRKKGSVPVYGSNGVVGYHTEHLIDFNTIIIGRKGSAGEITYVDEPSWPIDTTYYIKTRYNLKYIYYLLMSLGLSKIKQRGVKPGLNRDDAYDLPINFVDNLSEQEEIARILNNKSKEIEMLTHQIVDQLNAINQLPASILNEVFGQYQINS
ncbi:Type I restriction modification DNA specificity domain protein [uncultured archaeon]|nr:Type I restriction modification DNA specificity domain protein [uncultured archaeon]